MSANEEAEATAANPFALLRQAAARPLIAATYNSLALSYLEQPPARQLHALAITFYQKSLQIDPANVQTYLGLGRAYHWLGYQQQALDCAEQALAIDPGCVEAQVYRCRWQIPVIHADDAEIAPDLAAYRARLLELDELIIGLDPAARAACSPFIAFVRQFVLSYQGADVRELQQLSGRIMQRVLAQAYPQWFQPLRAPRRPGAKIRVGIVSASFWSNPDWYIFMKGWLTALDRERFSLFAYALEDHPDEETAYARAHCDRFATGDRSLEQWADLISRDRLDVLLYPNPDLSSLSISLATLRLAPVQCATWAPPLTTGLANIDFYLVPELGEAADGDTHYSEQLVRLPNLGSYYIPRQPPAVRVQRSDFGLRDGAVVYMCGQTLFKYHPRFDSLYPRIASQVPNAQFVFSRRSHPDEVARLFNLRLHRAFAEHGLRTDDYVVMLQEMPYPVYNAMCGLCDVYLDSPVFNGCVTTIDLALPNRLPIVTLPGAMLASRQGLAILRQLGVTETVAADADEFVAIAVRLGNDADHRRYVSARMAENEHRAYRDRSAIAGLEAFLEGAVRGAG